MALGRKLLAATSRRKPPPGYRHAQNEMRSGSGYQRPQQVLHDGSVNPKGTGPFRRPSRGPTRRTPGARSRRGRPTVN
jgi:hypothetical protein